MEGREPRARSVGVGTVIAHGLLHGSGRAALPHPALALGSDAMAALCRQTYSLRRTERTWPALCPGRVLLEQVPLGQSPSLHRLRPRLPGFVRRLHWYYETVRLPGLVHHRRASLDFPTRPAARAAGEPRTSRFSCEVFPYVHGVCDRAGPERISRLRCARCCLPPIPTTSASRTKLLSRLNTRPARTPVNASAIPLRQPPHDSGPLWVASPSTYDSFIHNTPPVYPGAFKDQSEAICLNAASTNRFAWILAKESCHCIDR